MARGVSKELDSEIHRTLEEYVNAKPGIYATTPLGTDRLTVDAVQCLAGIGAIEKIGTGSYRLTAQGRDYWEQRTNPRWYWFRRNWFPASVAAGTILFAAAAAAANIVNLVL